MGREMAMTLRTAFAAAIYLCLNPAFAAAPAGLLNKTVHISYAAYRPNRAEDGSSVKTPRTYQVTLYISGQGRIFDKKVVRHGKFSRDNEYGPERTSSSFQFEGSRLIGTARAGNGATQWTVTFDGNFQSCSIEIRAGGENGAPIVWTGLNGKKYTATGPTTYSAQTCSVQSGNAFAN
jgi:hypothetical protein